MQKEMPLHAITVDDLIAQLQDLRKRYGGLLEVLERGTQRHWFTMLRSSVVAASVMPVLTLCQFDD
jgi:hypothetical protein